MNYQTAFLSVITSLLLSSCAEQQQLSAQHAGEYARYTRQHGTIAAKRRHAATKATRIEGQVAYFRTKKTIRIPMSKEEQNVVRRLFAGVEAPPLLEARDWLEYQRYERNMIHPTPPAAFCNIVFLAADGTELDSQYLFESPWSDIGDKKDADKYSEFKDGSDMGDEINGRYIPKILADGELIRQFNALPVMDKLGKKLQDAYRTDN